MVLTWSDPLPVVEWSFKGSKSSEFELYWRCSLIRIWGRIVNDSKSQFQDLKKRPTRSSYLFSNEPFCALSVKDNLPLLLFQCNFRTQLSTDIDGDECLVLTKKPRKCLSWTHQLEYEVKKEGQAQKTYFSLCTLETAGVNDDVTTIRGLFSTIPTYATLTFRPLFWNNVKSNPFPRNTSNLRWTEPDPFKNWRVWWNFWT